MIVDRQSIDGDNTLLVSKWYRKTQSVKLPQGIIIKDPNCGCSVGCANVTAEKNKRSGVFSIYVDVAHADAEYSTSLPVMWR